MSGELGISMKEFKPDVHVLARIAEALYQNNSIKKTNLHSISRTDWNSFEKYMVWLLARNYIVCHNDDEYRYKLTDVGRNIFNTILMLHDNIQKLQSIINV
jgi:predicted transcriptional regulator